MVGILGILDRTPNRLEPRLRSVESRASPGVQEALTRRSSWLTLVARCECLERHGVSDGVGERENEVGADF
jgi:hypothetical protein